MLEVCEHYYRKLNKYLLKLSIEQNIELTLLINRINFIPSVSILITYLIL